uniref:RAB6-interacting golgin n=1 Tax=Panagrellus redivivus TaxID=6233 RepID=A0A7E4VQ26_PANRE
MPSNSAASRSIIGNRSSTTSGSSLASRASSPTAPKPLRAIVNRLLQELEKEEAKKNAMPEDHNRVLADLDASKAALDIQKKKNKDMKARNTVLTEQVEALKLRLAVYETANRDLTKGLRESQDHIVAVEKELAEEKEVTKAFKDALTRCREAENEINRFIDL